MQGTQDQVDNVARRPWASLLRHCEIPGVRARNPSSPSGPLRALGIALPELAATDCTQRAGLPHSAQQRRKD